MDARKNHREYLEEHIKFLKEEVAKANAAIQRLPKIDDNHFKLVGNLQTIDCDEAWKTWTSYEKVRHKELLASMSQLEQMDAHEALHSKPIVQKDNAESRSNDVKPAEKSNIYKEYLEEQFKFLYERIKKANQSLVEPPKLEDGNYELPGKLITRSKGDAWKAWDDYAKKCQHELNDLVPLLKAASKTKSSDLQKLSAQIGNLADDVDNSERRLMKQMRVHTLFKDADDQAPEPAKKPCLNPGAK